MSRQQGGRLTIHHRCTPDLLLPGRPGRHDKRCIFAHYYVLVNTQHPPSTRATAAAIRRSRTRDTHVPAPTIAAGAVPYRGAKHRCCLHDAIRRIQPNTPTLSQPHQFSHLFFSPSSFSRPCTLATATNLLARQPPDHFVPATESSIPLHHPRPRNHHALPCRQNRQAIVTPRQRQPAHRPKLLPKPEYPHHALLTQPGI